jgi:hypothetical protein
VAFDRLLARMFDPSQPARDGWVLKGGYVLEMRFHMARSTKDLDLTVRTRAGDSSSLRERLQLAASIDLPDFFTFIVGEAMAELNQAPGGGARFPVDAVCALAEGRGPRAVVFLLEPQELELSFTSQEDQKCIVNAVRFPDHRRDSENGEALA